MFAKTPIVGGCEHNRRFSTVDGWVQILYGQSIGGAVSIDLASRNPEAVGVIGHSSDRRFGFSPISHPQIRALILENTFMTLPSLIPSALPILSPFAFLCHQKWESANKLPKIPVTTPILMLSGVQDEVVPAEHMKALWEIAKKRRKTRSFKVWSAVCAQCSGSDGGQTQKDTEDGREVTDGTGKSKFVEFPQGRHSGFHAGLCWANR